VVLMIAQYLKNPAFFRRRPEIAPDDIFEPVPAAVGD
jgi:hypothetical protein